MALAFFQMTTQKYLTNGLLFSNEKQVSNTSDCLHQFNYFWWFIEPKVPCKYQFQNLGVRRKAGMDGLQTSCVILAVAGSLTLKF